MTDLGMQSGQCILKIDHHARPVTTAAWSPDGQSFVTGSLDGDHRLCLWSITGHQIYNWSINYRVQDCAISPDGKRLVVISSECQIVVYHYETREEEYSILLKSRMTCINVSRDSRYMLINMANSEVQLIEIETAEIVRRFLGQQQGEFVIRSCFGGADQNLVISGSEGDSMALRLFLESYAYDQRQIRESTSGTKQTVRSLNIWKATRVPAASTSLHGTRLIHACSLLAAMTGRLECRSYSSPAFERGIKFADTD